MSAVQLKARARGFAQALDADDFAAARRYLAPDCRYHVRGETLHGPDAVLESYQQASRAAQALFDGVAYASQVLSIDGNTVRVGYEDILTLAGETHIHHARQRLTFGADGHIVQIEHEDLPGERQRLQGFLARFGKALK